MYILILKYILIALCLAYVTHVFSKKREVMLDVKRHVLEKRLKLYALTYTDIDRHIYG